MNDVKINQAQKQNGVFAHIFFILSLIFITGILSACSDSTPSDSDANGDNTSAESGVEVVEKKDEKPAIPVEVTVVKRGDIKNTYQTITTLEPEQEADVIARSTGLVQNIAVEEGDRVTKGQILAQLDVEQLALEVSQLEATSNKLKKELQRQEQLYKRKLTSLDALDKIKYEYQSHSATFELAKLKYNYATIEAPIDGIVTERLIKPGNLIRENAVLFKIVNPSSLKAVLHLPEKEVSHVKKGQSVLLSVSAQEDQMFVGHIERIRPSIDSNTGTFKVVASLDNTDNYLRSGMFGKVEVVFEIRKDRLILEQQAIITQDNRSHVFVVEDNKAVQKNVTIGFKHDGMVEILDGLKVNDQVVTTGQQIVKNDSAVEVIGLTEEDEALALAKDNTNVATTPISQ
ncbi:MAG: efflux RND transporter periplasmic adaptor subunit [Gammaproteobacteria bacterium]|nr:efflux RND transporter periplasmic adaptor subunit [Gammaproteobacteria bacterium]MDH5629824.1 efflux RND transporter periplasmic adaptor subunit [Gammaproteobacteria bacterium]